MITTLTIATLTPFMVADTQEQVDNIPQETTASYSWTEQKAESIIDEDECRNGSTASFSLIPGGRGAQCVDDWHLA
ncbi:MAG: hypothetical protein IJE66_04790 [Akkermansia sp.]|nr:hypothetical protein [Akkermansia sp.]